MEENLEEKTKVSRIVNIFTSMRDWRRYEIPAAHVAVIYQDNKFFKPEYYAKARSILDNGTSTENFLKMYSDHLMPRAGVKGPTKRAFLWPRTDYILVPTDTQTYDPEPEISLSKIKIRGEDLPLNVYFNMKMNYELDPILYSIENAGKILAKDENWKKEFLGEIKTSAGLGIANHSKQGFPKILEPASLNQIPGDQRRNLKKRGINIIDFVAIAHVDSEDLKQLWDFLSEEDRKTLEKHVQNTPQ